MQMNLRKCPICEMPNDADCECCEECGHDFTADLTGLTRDEITAIFQKERFKYQGKLKIKAKEEHQREFYSLQHLFGYYVVNILAIMGIIMLLNRFGYKIDDFFHSIAHALRLTKESAGFFRANYYTIKYGIFIVIFQLFFNMFQLRKIDKKIVLVIFNVLIVIGLASFAISYKLMM
jgi:hypothetical protein